MTDSTRQGHLDSVLLHGDPRGDGKNLLRAGGWL
jgi:hypothetical protein